MDTPHSALALVVSQFSWCLA